VDDAIARLLAIEGFNHIEQLAWIETEELASISGFDADIAEELQARANSWLEKRDEEIMEKLQAMEIEEGLMELEEVTAPMLLTLAENDIRSLVDLAMCDNDELAAVGDGLLYPFIQLGHIDDEIISSLIMHLRVETGLIPADDPSDDDTSAGDTSADTSADDDMSDDDTSDDISADDTSDDDTNADDASAGTSADDTNADDTSVDEARVNETGVA
ncbi:MAG: hypothetical protein K0U36_07225, partial [Alphaproteobacteria bacterium]|nr:hypothetical protein [Alphaproteobacteria bacterium]